MRNRRSEPGETADRSLPKRLRDAVANEFTPPPKQRPRPSRDQLAQGHLAVGGIDEAVEDSPGEVQGADLLIISAAVAGHGRIRRQVICPLSMPGSGRGLVGQAIGFRHTTLDPDFADDVLVIRWPEKVTTALEPFRPVGPGALRARLWRFLGQCGAVLAVSGILLTVVMVIGLLTGGELFAELPARFRPGVALVASVAAVLLGLIAFAVGNRRTTSALPGPRQP